MTRLEAQPLSHNLAAVLIPRGLPPRELRAIRERLGLICRHGARIHQTHGRCPACAVARGEDAS